MPEDRPPVAGDRETEISEVEITAALQRILESRVFAGTPVLRRFLKHVVERTAHGQADGIKEYSLGVDVFDRGADFDGRVDTIVRVEARRLRSRLAAYYAGLGCTDAVIVELPPGSYVPTFRRRPPYSPGSRPTPGLSDREVVVGRVPTDFPVPPARTPLIGREDDIRTLQHLIGRPEVRLVTVTGPGGSGKTSLALETGRRLVRRFAGGVWFLELGAIADDEAAIFHIAHAVGVRQAGDSPLDAIRSRVRETVVKPTLFIVDNVEQLAGIGRLLSSLLDGSGGLTLLVTSRRLLRVAGEFNFVTTPLAVPCGDARLPLDELAKIPAVALFVQRATAVDPSFHLSDATAGPVTEICIGLDGLPLALELAVARVRVQDVAAIAARTGSRLDLLIDGASDGPERQRTLRATLEWSHAALAPGDRRLFQRLAVFAGSFTAESVEAVCNVRGDLDRPALDGLASLLDMSLLHAPVAEGTDRRFTMLTTMREFALELLVESGERDAVAHAHAAYCLVIAEEGIIRRSPGEFAEWLALCDVEHDNHRAALAWLIHAGRADWAMRLAVGLYRYWEHREYLVEGRAWFEAILCLPAASGSRAERARALTYAASFADAQGDNAIAYDRHLEALAIYRELDDARGEIRTLNALSAMRRFCGDHDGAIIWARQTLERCRDLGDAAAVAAALSNLGDVMFRAGDHDAGRRVMQDAHRAFAELRDPSGMARAVNHLGDMAAELGRYSDAARLYQDGSELFERLGDRWGLARSACDLGHLACAAGDLEAAQRRFDEALTIFDGLGHRRGIASALDGCARVAADRGDRRRALRLAGAAAALRRTTGAAPRPDDDRKLERVRDLAPASAAERKSWTAGTRMTDREAIDYALTPAPSRKLRSSPDRAAAAPPRSDPPAGRPTGRVPG